MKRRLRIRVSRLAERDLDQIWYETAKRSGSEDLATAVIESITDLFPLFASNPEAGRARPEIGADVRSFPVEKYFIYYKTGDGRVVISRILHGMRDQKSAFGTSIG